MRRIPQYFIQGLIFVLPFGITIYLLYSIFLWLDSIIPTGIPGLGIIFMLVLITLLGFAFQLMVATPIYKYLSRFVDKAPTLKLVYSSIKDLFSAFIGKEKKFDQPVLVTIDSANKIKRVGFLTQRNLEFMNLPEGFVAVYFPYSYGLLGELMIVSESAVSSLDLPPAEVMKFIVSGGVSKITGSMAGE